MLLDAKAQRKDLIETSSAVESAEQYQWAAPGTLRDSQGFVLAQSDFKKAARNKTKPAVLSAQGASGALSQKKMKFNMDLPAKKHGDQHRSSLTRRKQKTDMMRSARSPPKDESPRQSLARKPAQSNPAYSTFNPRSSTQPTPSDCLQSDPAAPSMKYLKMIYTSLSTINLAQEASDQVEIRKIAGSINFPPNLTTD